MTEKCATGGVIRVIVISEIHEAFLSPPSHHSVVSHVGTAPTRDEHLAAPNNSYATGARRTHANFDRQIVAAPDGQRSTTA